MERSKGDPPSVIPQFISVVHPERDQQFRTAAVSKRDIKSSLRDQMYSCCTTCGTPNENNKLKKCAKCRLVWYCSRDCQKQNWPAHKQHCRPVQGDGIEKLIKAFDANQMLFYWLQVLLVLEFNLLNKPCPRRPLLAHIDVGIEPSKITDFMNLFYFKSEFDLPDMEGMLQLDFIFSEGTAPSPLPKLSEFNTKLWQAARKEADEGECKDNPVILVQFVNNMSQVITTIVTVSDEALEEVRLAEPFTMTSALTGLDTTKPLSTDSCLEYINTHIRSDVRNRLLLRAPMREVDKELIREAGRNKNAHAPQAVKRKMARESVYVSHQLPPGGSRSRHTVSTVSG